MFAEDDIQRRKDERDEADRSYNDALTALDHALPGPATLPAPPAGYDEQQLPLLNQRFAIMPADPLQGVTGWRRKLAGLVWRLMGPVLAQQQAFNAAVVDHFNRNVDGHRESPAALEGTIGALRVEWQRLEAFHAKLIQYLQTITRYVDTKDRSEHIATLATLANAGLGGIADESLRRWESMLAREQRYMAAVDELRTSIAGVQQTGLTLKRELERLVAGRTVEAAPASTGTTVAAAPAPAASQPVPMTGAINAYKYVGFENKFRGSEAEIRERQFTYLEVFRQASDVLDLGCGRGEFLALLQQEGISARGLDINHEMVELCRSRGLEAAEGDAIAYLEGLPDGALGGLIALQVAEHFQPSYLVRFLDVAYHKLRPGSRLVLETLNPACWYAFFEAYIRDITHAWPLHPETLKYLVVASGFQRVEVRMLSPFPEDATLQHVRVPADAATLPMVNLTSTFNENVSKLNAVMFSHRDYAVVAERM